MLSDEEEVYLLTKEEADALVKKGHGEALRWLESALKDNPGHDSTAILETAKNLLAASMPELDDDYSELENIVIERLASITDYNIQTQGIRAPLSASEHVSELTQHAEDYNPLTDANATTAGAAVPHPEPTVDDGLSIFDALKNKYDNILGSSTSNESDDSETSQELMDSVNALEEYESPAHVEDSGLDEKEVSESTNELVEESETSIFDMLSAKHGMTDEPEGETSEVIEEISDSEETTAEPEPLVVEESGTSIFDMLSAKHGMTDEPDTNENDIVEELPDEVESMSKPESLNEVNEPTNELVEESGTSIFDMLSAKHGMANESEEVADDSNEESVSDEVLEELSDSAETVSEPELIDEVVEENETSIFDMLSAKHGMANESEEVSELEQEAPEEEAAVIETETSHEVVDEVEIPEDTIDESEIIDDSASFDWFEGEKATEVATQEDDEEEVFIPAAEISDETIDEEEQVEEPEELLLETKEEEEVSEAVVQEDDEEEVFIPAAEISDEISTEEEITIVPEPVIVEANINRYEYVDSDEDSEEGDDDEDNSIDLYKEYGTEEAGEIVNNTLKVQEFDAEKKLVATSSSADVDFSIIKKDYDAGEEYTSITETVIEKPAEENPEQVKDFGSNANISLGRGYEAPEEETVIIPEPEVNVEVAEPLVDGSKKKRRLFGKDEEPTSYEYEKDAEIPVASIDEEEINQGVSEQGLSREGRNIDFISGSNEIEIGDDVYEAQQEGLSARGLPEQNTDDMNMPTIEDVEVPEDEDDGTSGVSRKDLNTRQLIKDIKIIDTF